MMWQTYEGICTVDENNVGMPINAVVRAGFTKEVRTLAGSTQYVTLTVTRMCVCVCVSCAPCSVAPYATQGGAPACSVMCQAATS